MRLPTWRIPRFCTDPTTLASSRPRSRNTASWAYFSSVPDLLRVLGNSIPSLEELPAKNSPSVTFLADHRQKKANDLIRMICCCYFREPAPSTTWENGSRIQIKPAGSITNYCTFSIFFLLLSNLRPLPLSARIFSWEESQDLRNSSAFCE